MTKDEWQQLYEILSNIYSGFVPAYSRYTNGKNKKVRDTGSGDVNSAIRSARMHIEKHFEPYALLTGEQGNDYSRAVNYDEFIQPRYFGGDSNDFLKKIKAKIDQS